MCADSITGSLQRQKKNTMLLSSPMSHPRMGTSRVLSSSLSVSSCARQRHPYYCPLWAFHILKDAASQCDAVTVPLKGNVSTSASWPVVVDCVYCYCRSCR